MAQVLPAVLFGVALAAATASAASAQSPPPGQGARAPIGTVTVTGRRPPGSDVIKTVIAPYVAAHTTPDRLSGLMVRQTGGVCPITMGLITPFDDFVTRRIVEVARQVGATVLPADHCRHNVQVVFTTEPQRLVENLVRQTSGHILGPHFVHETKALSHDIRPIQAWYVTGTVSDTGPYPVMRYDADGEALAQGAVEVDDLYGTTPYSGLGSRIRPRNSSQFVNTLIVVDLNQVEGREIGPISDYVTMLALSNAQSLDDCGPLPSILDLMAKGCEGRPAPQSLTDADFAFLKALYAVDITGSGSEASARIERAMARTLGPAALGQARPGAP